MGRITSSGCARNDRITRDESDHVEWVRQERPDHTRRDESRRVGAQGTTGSHETRSRRVGAPGTTGLHETRRITSSGCARNDRITRDEITSSGCARNDRITRDESDHVEWVRQERPDHTRRVGSRRVGAPGTTGSHETSSGCARNDRVTRDETKSRVIRSFLAHPLDVIRLVSCDPVVPGAPTRRDPTHRIKLLKK